MKTIHIPFLPLIRKYVYISLYLFDYLFQRKPKLFILCYHAIGNDDWRYGVSYATLKKQLAYLVSHYSTGTMRDVEQIIQGKKKINKPTFVICFDDGYKDIYKTKELFQQYHIKPTLFILSDTTDADRKELANKRPFLSNKEILNLEKAGWVIGSHGATHANFDMLSAQELRHEIVDAKKVTEKILSHSIRYFAYPKGRYTKHVVHEMKKAGYTLGLSMNDGFIDTSTNFYFVPRIGVDRTHTFIEFKSLFSPSVVKFRKFIKEHIGIII